MDNGIANRLGVLETRLDTILPTLATKADVSDLRTRLDKILPTFATKADVSDAKASLVMWLGSIVAASTAIVIAVLLFAINKAFIA